MLIGSAVKLRGFLRLSIPMLLAAVLWAQQSAGSLSGAVVDESGAVIPGAIVKVLQGNNLIQRTQSDGLGKFVVPGLRPGKYAIHVAANGFNASDAEMAEVTAGGNVEVKVVLTVLTAKEQVTVTSEQTSSVALESTENANAVILQGADLDALPDDPDELMEDLQALAGPAVGSTGNQVYLDGFSSSRLPPKSSIREVRINQDPFSAQYDHVGFGRVEVFTKPGSDQIHGTAQFKMSDAVLNSRNPYSPIKPPYQAKQFSGSLGGPLQQRASFFLDYEGRWATDNEVVNATVLNPALNITPLTQAVLMPDNQQSLGGRLDYKLSDRHNLTARYEWDHAWQSSAGVGGFILPSRSYTGSTNAHTFQLTENAVLSNSAVNQTRFQFVQTSIGEQAGNLAPTLQVMDAFTAGGAQVANSQHSEKLLELQNYTTKTIGKHTLTFGAQMHRDAIFDYSPANFNGTFVFSGGLAPELNPANQIVLGANGNPVMVPLSSIQQYQRTVILQQAGFSPTSVMALGGGASQFSIAAGQPVSTLIQTDIGLFAQDSWRVTPNFMFDAGLRWEWQNDLHDLKDFAPRLGMAWMPGGKHSKTVIRMGAGIFYDRFPALQMLQTMRFNGQTQQQFVLDNPSFYPHIPTIAFLQGMGLPQTLRTLAPNLRSPYLMQASLGVEHQMPFKAVVSLNYIGTWGRHLLVSQNVTAPPVGGTAGSSFIPTKNSNYQYNSAGVLDQNQLTVNVRRSFSDGFAMFGRYEYSRAFGNTDGIDTFPAIQNNLQADYGRTATDIRHTFVMGGSMFGPFGTSFSPFLVVRSGAPFNITTGHDNNGDTIFTDRPSFATNPNQPGVMVTPFGIFNPTPLNGIPLIPHNYGQGPGFMMLNFRLSRTFGFGPVSGDGLSESGARPVPAMTGRGLFSAPNADHRYNVTIGVVVRNVFNTTNPGLPVGSLSSPFFGRSNWLASTAGSGEMAFGNNRRLQFQLRFSF